MTTSLAQALRWATTELDAAGLASAEADAVLIAAHLLGLDRGEVQAKAIIGAPVPQGFEDLVRQRARRIPLQHLTGTAPFRRIELAVGPGVFVPRPETELLVELAVQRLRTDQGEGVTRPVVVDLCTGSGAIAAALADEVPHAKVHAIELSEQAHAWALRNLEGRRVDLRLGDATVVPEDLRGRVHVVVSNPPYVPDREPPTDPEVAEHDPALALWGGGEDGMRVPDAVIAAAAGLLVPGGWCVVEHAESQRQAIAAAFHRHGFVDVECHNDLTGRPRATSALLPALNHPQQQEVQQ
ncbi:peptide chain release factor N(5)-glutamine methyltransferase [Kocuria sp. JC486]|uniref:Release factor glutamine methyltransferase n=1 Tax=Kocuria soli TaxID=2485125 RepID=A0A3N3ZSS7_9MICC|nr:MULTISPECIES: peptide chain release factor N(5)-glutamine methyltransferase [Kocuria]NHU84548.1 peptide chain release factor N(5)-glutamine methyltransferase [Kocuria sp. JC486]ROZ63019.1 peptide chain release factor N(5)-glutamine methyltransferase [Kocuria soli]